MPFVIAFSGFSMAASLATFVYTGAWGYLVAALLWGLAWKNALSYGTR